MGPGWIRSYRRIFGVFLVAAVVGGGVQVASDSNAQRKDPEPAGQEWLHGRWGVTSAAACGRHYYLFGGVILEIVEIADGKREQTRFADVNFEEVDGAKKIIFAIGSKPEADGDSTYTATRVSANQLTLHRPALLNGREKADKVTLVRCATSDKGWLYGRWGMRMGVLDTCGDCGEGDHISFYEFEAGRATLGGGRGSRRCALVHWSGVSFPRVDGKGALVDLGPKRPKLVITRTAKPDEVVIHTQGKKNDQFKYYRCKQYETE